MSFHGAFFGAPLPNLLVGAGVLFLFIAVVGEVSGKFDTDRKGRIAGGLIGPILIVTGLFLSPAIPAGTHATPTETPATTGTPTGTPPPTSTPTPAEPGTTEFSKSIVRGESGEEVEIPVSLGQFDQLYLVVGDESVNFVVEAWIADGSGDHNVTVIFDTDAPNSDRPILKPKDASDTVRIEREDYSDSLRNLDAGDYELTLFLNDFKDSKLDVATLVLQEPG